MGFLPKGLTPPGKAKYYRTADGSWNNLSNPKEGETGFGFGETMFQIFILNATRRLQADQFYTDCYTAEYYTQQGLDRIDAASLKTVILRHYPELASTGLGNIKARLNLGIRVTSWTWKGTRCGAEISHLMESRGRGMRTGDNRC